jgi:hypothetical protein
MIGLLDFLGSKIDELTSTTDIEELVQEVVFYLFGVISWWLIGCQVTHPAGYSIDESRNLPSITPSHP